MMKDVDGCTDAHAHIFQDVGCDEARPYQQAERPEVQYADVLEHRAGGKPHQGVLYAACRAEVGAV